jgi:hypothetical protein
MKLIVEKKERRNKRVEVLLTPTTFHDLSSAAKSLQISISEIINQLIMTFLAMQKKRDKKNISKKTN